MLGRLLLLVGVVALVSGASATHARVKRQPPPPPPPPPPGHHGPHMPRGHHGPSFLGPASVIMRNLTDDQRKQLWSSLEGARNMTKGDIKAKVSEFVKTLSTEMQVSTRVAVDGSCRAYGGTAKYKRCLYSQVIIAF